MSHPTSSIFNALGAALNPAYNILIDNITIDKTLDRIRVSLSLYSPDKPDYSGLKNITIKHSDFEDWCNANDLLELDDTHGNVDENGEYTERGSRYDISYTEFAMEHATTADFIQYLWQMESLGYGFDPDFLKQHQVTL